MRAALCAGALAACVAGCASPQERASNECQSIGYLPGDPVFDECYQATMARYQQANMFLMQTGLSMMAAPPLR
jgi:hypothetical protein